MKRALLIAAAVVTVVVVAAGLVYGIGLARMDRTAATLEAEPVDQNPVELAAPEETPPDPNSPFAKDIPGCVCHSEDRKLVEEHAEYRMNQCSGCHSEGVPTGQ